MSQPADVKFLPTSSQAISLPVAANPLVLLRTAVSICVLCSVTKIRSCIGEASPEQRVCLVCIPSAMPRSAARKIKMALPVKLQASILSWISDDASEPSEPSLSLPSVSGEGVGKTRQQVTNPFLNPADLFSLSNAGAAAGSPCVVVKDGFLGRSQALRAYEGACAFFVHAMASWRVGFICVWACVWLGGRRPAVGCGLVVERQKCGGIIAGASVLCISVLLVVDLVAS